MHLEETHWANIWKYTKVNKGNSNALENFNKVQFFISCLKKPPTSIKRFNRGGLKFEERLLVIIIAWQHTPRESNHVLLNECDLIMVHNTHNKIKINWIYVIKRPYDVVKKTT